VTMPAQLRTEVLPTFDDRARWVDTSKKLWQLLRRDHSSYRTQLEELYPESCHGMVQRPSNLVQRVAREMATLYIRPPVRIWRTSRGKENFAELQGRMSALYRMIGANRRIRTAQEHLVALSNATIWAWPEKKARSVRWLIIPPHEQWAELGDLVSDDIADVERWWVRLPVSRDESVGMVQYGVAEITPTMAKWISGPLRGEGLWDADGSNPIGEIPVVLLRQSDPALGDIFAWPPEDLLAAAHAQALDHTDQGHIARLQGYGQPVVSGMDAAAARELKIGPDNVIGLPDAEQSFEFVHGDPPLSEYAKSTELFVRSTLALLGMNPATVMKSTASTAVAKQIELMDRQTERARMIVQLEAAETRLYNLTAAWLGELRRDVFDYDRFGRVDIEYREPVLPADPLHDAQARRMAFEDGQLSPAKELARNRGISVEAARAQIRENVAELATLREIVDADGRIAQGREPGSE